LFGGYLCGCVLNEPGSQLSYTPIFALLRGLRCSLEARFIIARFLKNASIIFKKSKNFLK